MSHMIKRIPYLGNECLVGAYWDSNVTSWRISDESRRAFIHCAAMNAWLYLAIVEDEIGGLLVNEEGDTSAIWLLHVRPDLRGKGIGSTLFECAIQHVSGVWNAGSGSGYWWQGVPSGEGDCFLEKRGFEWSWTSIDMAMPLEKWELDASERTHGVRCMNHDEKEPLVHMLRAEEDLCDWIPIYLEYISADKLDQIYVVCENGDIIGCALLLLENEIRWGKEFAGKTGGIGCLGVKKDWRSQGIGASIVVAIMSVLKERGYDQSYIGYTWLEEWYGKFGYRTVHRFKMGGSHVHP